MMPCQARPDKSFAGRQTMDGVRNRVAHATGILTLADIQYWSILRPKTQNSTDDWGQNELANPGSGFRIRVRMSGATGALRAKREL